MSSLSFHKYHGTGNDFIMLDNRLLQMPTSVYEAQYEAWCHRRFGIGADGLILLQYHPEANFEMVYYNADGKIGSLCGNGSRCAVAFAYHLGIISSGETQFMASDGLHKAYLEPTPKDDIVWVRLEMQPVRSITRQGDDWVLDTGSPHYVRFVNHLSHENIVKIGREIRYAPAYTAKGINVNLVEWQQPEHIVMATYERGVEDETYSCGTGAVAAALASFCQRASKTTGSELSQTLHIKTKGGELLVSAHQLPSGGFDQVWLQGPAARVFIGEVPLSET